MSIKILIRKALAPYDFQEIEITGENETETLAKADYIYKSLVEKYGVQKESSGQTAKKPYTPKQSIGKCPKCSAGDIVETDKAFGCNKWREEDGACNFTIWKKKLNDPTGKVIDVETAKKMIAPPVTTVKETFPTDTPADPHALLNRQVSEHPDRAHLNIPQRQTL